MIGSIDFHVVLILKVVNGLLIIITWLMWASEIKASIIYSSLLACVLFCKLHERSSQPFNMFPQFFCAQPPPPRQSSPPLPPPPIYIRRYCNLQKCGAFSVVYNTVYKYPNWVCVGEGGREGEMQSAVHSVCLLSHQYCACRRLWLRHRHRLSDAFVVWSMLCSKRDVTVIYDVWTVSCLCACGA